MVHQKCANHFPFTKCLYFHLEKYPFIRKECFERTQLMVSLLKNAVLHRNSSLDSLRVVKSQGTRVLSFKIIFKFPKQSNMGQTCSAPQQTKHKRIPKQVKVITTDYKVSVLDEEEELLHEMWNHVVGKDAVMPTPFFEQGLKMTYCDYVASGRGLQPIETMISDSILPFYANTHTEASITGKTTNTLREEARIAIKRTCGGKVSTKCIFVGSGSTAAVQLIIGMLQLRQSIVCFVCLLPFLNLLKLLTYLNNRITFYHHLLGIPPFRKLNTSIAMVSLQE